MEIFDIGLRCGGQMRFTGGAVLDARFALKGTGASYAPDRTFDTEHIRLDLKLDLSKETLIGRCRTTLKAIVPSQEMVFDAVNFRIHSVKWNGHPTTYTYKDKKIRVVSRVPAKPGEKVDIEIAYTVTKPKLGFYFIKPDRSFPKKPTQVWTQGEDEYARYWFPCHDAPHERTSTEMIVTVPRGFTAVSNGRLVKATHSTARRTSTYHWLQSIPHATYLVTLTVGRFSEIRHLWRNVPVLFYCEKGREQEAERAFGKTPKMLEFFSSKIGVKYPYPKYAQVAVSDFIYGGMENTSATTQTDSALLDERAALDTTSDELVAHELAHQWFGDYLTCKHWAHAWLNESFATYFDALFKRHDKGEDEFRYQLYLNAHVYLAEDRDRYRRSIVTTVFRRPTDLFDRHLYEKGSLVLSMLHHLLGEDLFWKAISTYVKSNAGGVVETNDLINAIEDATGRNMRSFFDQWVFGPGHPEYKVRAWWDRRKKEMAVRVVQSNAEGPDKPLFRMPLEFRFGFKSGAKDFKEDLTKKSHLFRFKLPSEPEMVLFDPGHKILKKVDFPKEEGWLLTQLTKDPHPIGRVEAAQALAKIGNKTAIEALRSALLNDPFWAVQAEVASALGSIRREETSTALLHSLDVVEHPKVRRAIYGALKYFKSQAVADEVEKRFSTEKSYYAEMEGLRILGAMNHPRADEHLNAALKKSSWNEVLRTAALEGKAAERSTESIAILFAHTKESHPYKVRLAAIRSLAEFGPGHGAIQEKLIELAQDKFILAQVAALRALQNVGDERALPVLKKLTSGDRDGRVMRMAEEAIEKISKGLD